MQSPTTVLTDVEAELSNIPKSSEIEGSDMRTKINHWISEGAYRTVAVIAKAMINNRIELLKTEARYNICQAEDLMMGLKITKQYFKNMAAQSHGSDYFSMYENMALKSYIQNITGIVVMVNQFFPDKPFASCFNQVTNF